MHSKGKNSIVDSMIEMSDDITKSFATSYFRFENVYTG